MFSSGLEIFSKFNIHRPVNGFPVHVRFNLTKSTIVNHRFGRSSTSMPDKKYADNKKRTE